MYPEIANISFPARSEEDFYKDLYDSLSPEFHVFHSVYGHKMNGKRVKTNEFDFFIFHKKFGLLCIECKGGGTARIEGEKLTLGTLESEPYKKAKQGIHDIVAAYEKYCGGKDKKLAWKSCFDGQCIYGHAVAFPYQTDIPGLSEAQRELTIFKSDLGNLQKRIEEIFARHGYRESDDVMSNDSAHEFINFLDGHYMTEFLKNDFLDYQEQLLLRINDYQDSVIDMLSLQKRVFFEGVAGSGKTWLAIKKLAKSINEGKSVLYLCYNGELAKFVTNELAKIVFEKAQFVAFTAPSLLYREFVKSPFVEFEYEDRKDTFKVYDLIVVDEAQDFTNHWAEKIQELLAPDGSLYVFWDGKQDIFDRQKGNIHSPANIWNIPTPAFVLNRNLRNTKQIHNYIALETGIGGDEYANMLEGIEVIGYEKTDAETVRQEIETIVDRLVNKEGISSSRIIIISNLKIKHSSSVFHENQDIAGLKVFEPQDKEDYVPSEKLIEYRTIQKIKGCERDVVINISHPEIGDEKYNALRYTALSRAKFMLYDFEIDN